MYMFQFDDPNQYRCQIQFYDPIHLDDSTRFNSTYFDSIRFEDPQRGLPAHATEVVTAARCVADPSN